jgi:hypothetical protein
VAIKNKVLVRGILKRNSHTCLLRVGGRGTTDSDGKDWADFFLEKMEWDTGILPAGQYPI